MGRLDARRYCCSGDMIADLAAERLLVAYSVVGSYALISSAKGQRADHHRARGINPAADPHRAGADNRQTPDLGGNFLQFLRSSMGQASLQGKPGIGATAGLLASLDRVR